jgi:ABC-type transporter Mla maintaining outer membrane lipid asymmetry ATPase subunit MlaF
MGQDIGDMPEKELLNFRRHIGFVFQEGALFDSMTVADNVSFRLDEEKVDESEIETRVREALRFVEMEPSMEKYPGELSGGMRRRVSIARALVDRPPLVFYDSPTAGLDPVTCQTIITLILRGRDSQGVTSLLATQRVQDAFGLANFRFDKTTGHIVRDSPNEVARCSDPCPRESREWRARREAIRCAKFPGSSDQRPRASRRQDLFRRCGGRVIAFVGRVSESISGFGGITFNVTRISEEVSRWRNANN